MVTAEVQVNINCPPETVFDLWADMRTDKDWHPIAIGKVEMLTPEPLGVGTVFRGEYKGMGVVTEETTAFSRPHQLGRRGEAKNFRVESTFNFSPNGTGGTLLTAKGTVWPKGVMRLMEPLMRLMMQQQFSRVMNALKLEAESRAS